MTVNFNEYGGIEAKFDDNELSAISDDAKKSIVDKCITAIIERNKCIADQQKLVIKGNILSSYIAAVNAGIPMPNMESFFK